MFTFYTCRAVGEPTYKPSYIQKVYKRVTYFISVMIKMTELEALLETLETRLKQVKDGELNSLEDSRGCTLCQLRKRKKNFTNICEGCIANKKECDTYIEFTLMIAKAKTKTKKLDIANTLKNWLQEQIKLVKQQRGRKNEP